MRRIRMSLCVAVLLVMALCAFTPLANGVTRAGLQASGSARDPATPIHHVVVMTQEGHSFDNYFGQRRGVDGLDANDCSLTASDSHGGCVSPYPISGSPHARLNGTAAAQARAVDGGRMDGFVRAQAVHGSNGKVAMGYYPAREIPVLTGIADRGIVFDHWFAAVPGSGVANDLFAVTARSPGDVGAVPRAGWSDMPTIFDRLEQAGVSWRIYVEGYQPSRTIQTVHSAQDRSTGQVARVPVLATRRFIENPSLMSHVMDLRRYYDDLAQHHLPAVSFIVSTHHTERPPRSPRTDQQLVRAVANGLISSAAWRHTAFFLTYNSSGGWYDHVPPPELDGARTGLRVPTVLLSPYAQANTVNHSTYDSASILKLIEENWSLSSLTSRDRTAKTLLPVFAFKAAPSRPALVDVTPSRPPVHQPSRAVLYVGYLVALLAALGGVALGAYSRPRRWEPRHR